MSPDARYNARMTLSMNRTDTAPRRHPRWRAACAWLLGMLLLPAAQADASVEEWLPVPSGNEIPVEMHAAAGDLRLIWLPSEFGTSPSQTRIAEALHEVGGKHEHARGAAQGPKDIGRADVSAAEAANIHLPGAGDEITGRDRSQQVGGDANDDIADESHSRGCW